MVRIPKDGILAMYKEPGISSHRVVLEIRRHTGGKVGHAGTLDLYASGVLVVGVGRAATKRLSQVAGTDKEYVTRIRLGCTSTTDDREGRIETVDVSKVPSAHDVSEALARFVGVIAQRPPAFSALKIKGKPAYKLARAHKPVNLKPRQVEVRQIELLKYEWPLVQVRMVTGPGLYVRAFARDLGSLLGTGAYVEELERTRVGPYMKDQAVRLSDLAIADFGLWIAD